MSDHKDTLPRLEPASAAAAAASQLFNGLPLTPPQSPEAPTSSVPWAAASPEMHAGVASPFDHGCMVTQAHPVFLSQPMLLSTFQQPVMWTSPVAAAPPFVQGMPQACMVPHSHPPVPQEAWSHHHPLHAPAPTPGLDLQRAPAMPSWTQAFAAYDNFAPGVNPTLPTLPTPATVVPSELGPQDPTATHPSVRDDRDMSQQQPKPSFRIGATGCGDWPAAGEHVTGNNEPVIPSSSACRTLVLPSRASSSRVKQGPRRRNRKNQAWYEYESYGFQFRCEGTPFVEVGGRFVPQRVGKVRKPHLCRYHDSHGVRCPASFERSEHLKRHMTMHSKERPYPCPLRGCNKAISRPDNAGDHFKTHLRPSSRGKRNRHWSFRNLEMALRRTPAYHDDRKRSKILANLRKWMDGLSAAEKDAIAMEDMRAATADEKRQMEEIEMRIIRAKL